MNEFIQKISGVSKIIEDLKEQQKFIDDIVSPIIDYDKFFKNTNAKVKNCIIELAKYSWFLGMEHTPRFFDEILKYYKNDNITEIDEVLIDYYNDKVGEIRELVKMHFPKRYVVLNSALDAHSNRKYELSVPIILIQTDGICKELTNKCFFMKTKDEAKNNVPQTYDFFLNQCRQGTVTDAFLYPFREVTSINISEKERPENSTILNRHNIIHGEFLEYNSELNSCKSLSLLYYVLTIIKDNGE